MGAVGSVWTDQATGAGSGLPFDFAHGRPRWSLAFSQ